MHFLYILHPRDSIFDSLGFLEPLEISFDDDSDCVSDVFTFKLALAWFIDLFIAIGIFRNSVAAN